MREVSFSKTPNGDLSEWFAKSNGEPKEGKHDLVLLLKRLKVKSGENINDQSSANIDFSVQIFWKDGNKYHFIYKKDTVFSYVATDVSKTIVKAIPKIFTTILNKSISLKPYGGYVSQSDLSDFETYSRERFSAFNNLTLKEGIYTDYISFFQQNPESGNFTFERNEKGEVLRAIKEENGQKVKIPSRKMFAYVENGKAYKLTFFGFTELLKNEKGFYVFSNRGFLFPVQTNATYGMFGLIGGIAEAIDQSGKQKKQQKADKVEIYIDPLTGEYDFPD